LILDLKYFKNIQDEEIYVKDYISSSSPTPSRSIAGFSATPNDARIGLGFS